MVSSNRQHTRDHPYQRRVPCPYCRHVSVTGKRGTSERLTLSGRASCAGCLVPRHQSQNEPRECALVFAYRNVSSTTHGPDAGADDPRPGPVRLRTGGGHPIQRRDHREHRREGQEVAHISG